MTGNVLEGIRVADWTMHTAGSKGTVWLAALGAEVIKIERAGDPSQSRGGFEGQINGVPVARGEGVSILFEAANYNKKSITVDLSQEKGRQIIYRLVEKSDIFATNQLPDTIEKLRMDYDTLVNYYNPQIIYVTNNILGYKGPHRLTPGMDGLGQAVSGVMFTSGARGQPPTLASPGMADLTSAFAMVCGVLAALLYRQRTGKGQRVDTSQMQALMNGPLDAVLSIYSTLSEEQRKANPYGGECRSNPREDALNPESNYYQCKDDKWIYIVATSDKYFVNIVKAIGHPELAKDPRFADRKKRTENRKKLFKLFDETFAQRTAAEWRERFKGLDIPFYPVNRLPDLLEDPQVKANDVLWTVEHPKLGTVKLPGMPFNLSESPGRMVTPAPELGQNTEEVLLNLGYTWPQILQLREEKVI